MKLFPLTILKDRPGAKRNMVTETDVIVGEIFIRPDLIAGVFPILPEEALPNAQAIVETRIGSYQCADTVSEIVKRLEAFEFSCTP